MVLIHATYYVWPSQYDFILPEGKQSKENPKNPKVVTILTANVGNAAW